MRTLLALLASLAAAPLAAQAPSVAAPFAAMPDPVSRAAPQPVQRLGVTDADRKRFAVAAGRLAPQRPGIVDAYVVAIALDSDHVFAREAREAGRVLAHRFDAEGRTLVLAGPDGRGIDPLPRGAPETLAAALARVGATMDLAEDVLVLYTSGHGTPGGLAWREQGELLATLPPAWLESALKQAGIRNRLLILSACFSGLFVPMLSSPEGAVVTAAAADRSSFGCVADNDWTFFGDALVNHALRKPLPLAAAVGEARSTVAGWEAREKVEPSNPQTAIGARTAAWLRPLEARMPKAATAPVGRPAIDTLEQADGSGH